jgi:hypothetical protein
MNGFKKLTPQHLTRISRRSCALQGLPEDTYDTLPPERRDSFERGAASVIQALDSLGFRFEVPSGW